MIRSEKIRRTLVLAAVTLGLSFVWLVLLPAYANQPAMKQHLKWLDDQGIDPSAMYYTELQVMEDILARRRSEDLGRFGDNR